MRLTDKFILAKKCLDDHQVIAFPTETVMGLGVYYDSFEAYQLLNKVKGRPDNKPYTLMVGDISGISKYAYISDRENKLIKAFMPGPVTFLLNAKEAVPGYVTHNTGVIGIRIPDIEELRNFIRYCGKPLLVPSANKSGEKPAMSDKEVKDIFGSDVSYIFEGSALGGVPSTIVDLTQSEVKIIREGPISINEINKVLGE